MSISIVGSPRQTAPVVSGASWMTQSIGQIGLLPLRSVAVPGAHDSGMSTLTNSTIGSNSCNTQTQSVDIFQQLNDGVRYFDFRPVTWPGSADFYHGHFSAGVGRYWASAMNDLGQFIQQQGSENEVVVFKLSHFLQLSQAPPFGVTISGQPFGLDNFNDLVNAIQSGLGSSLFTSDDPNISLNDTTIADLTATQGRIIVVLDLGSGFPQEYVNPSQGIFSYNDLGNGSANLVVYDNYYGASDLNGMEADQLAKFQAFTPAPGTSFLLSWTLTQTNPLSSTCISDLAAQANAVLMDAMQSWVDQGAISAQKRPSVVYSDFIADQSVALATCMYLNYLGT
jgi:hypothetical protein